MAASSSSTSFRQALLASCSSMNRDNSDYQWASYAPTSILSSLFDSSGHLSLYDDMILSKDFEDEELAEIDMESFCREDIHNLLLNKNRRGSCGLLTSSLYRPESLFSPVPDAIHLSQDSLDLSGYPNEGDIIMTCKANKDNYTIAFEGSFICSEASFYAGAESDALDQRKRDLLEDLERRKASIKMSTSDYNLTTWSMLKKTHNSSNLSRFLVDRPLCNRKVQCWAEKRPTMGSSVSSSSGPSPALLYPVPDTTDPLFLLRRTKSMSSLMDQDPQVRTAVQENRCPAAGRCKLNVSQVIIDNMDQVDSSSPSYDQNKLLSLLPNCAIPIHHSQQQQQQSMKQMQALLMEERSGDSASATITTSNNNPAQSNSGDRQQPSFNLVKLFIKQKSNSTDTCMDVSSGCWPSDSSSQSFEHQNINANIQNRNYFKRRLEGSAASMARHEEENEVDSLDPLLNNNNYNNNNNNGEADQNKTVDAVTEEKKNHSALENNNNLINNLINNNHLGDSSEEQNITQIYNNIRNSGVTARQPIPKSTRRCMQMDTVTRSMQTSIPKLITSATQYAAAAASNRSTCSDASAFSQHVNIVPSSFLRQLHKNDRRGEIGVAPVYVIYPSYTLPNLDFVAKHDVILSPIDYKEQFTGVNSGAISKVKMKRTSWDSPSNGAMPEKVAVLPREGFKQRPKSFNDILSGKKTKLDYKNICDWRSLIVLLPVEYVRILRSIPEIEKQLEGLNEEMDDDDGFGDGEHLSTLTSSQSQKQMFCQTTPVMRRKLARTSSCDCTAYIMQTTSSSSSSSNQPASSGYRGSSTILTDSELGVADHETEFSDDTAAGLPPTHCGRTPKGILRRNFNRSRLKLQQVKRNSMFDYSDEKMVDKRRSLQEFPTQQYFDNIQLAAHVIEDYGPVSPLLNYKQQQQQLDGNDLNSANRFKKKLSSELEALEFELLETRNIPRLATGAVERANVDDVTALAYDRLKLRNDVSRALCNHPKRVSFSESNSDSTEMDSVGTVVVQAAAENRALTVPQRFTTPPNSPNISVMALKKRARQTEQERIQSNRFKRLQIQWELLSKDSESLLQEMNEIVVPKMETKSGGSTPTGPQRISRIPRPISYPSSSSAAKTGVGRNSAVAMKRGGKVSSPTAVTASPRVQGSKLGKKTNTTTTNRYVPKAR